MKALELTVVSFGRLISLSALQDLKAEEPISLRWESGPILTLLKLLQPSKACPPILATESGIAISLRDLQSDLADFD